MLMVAAAEIIGAVAAVLLSYRRRFDHDGAFLAKGDRRDRANAGAA